MYAHNKLSYRVKAVKLNIHHGLEINSEQSLKLDGTLIAVRPGHEWQGVERLIIKETLRVQCYYTVPAFPLTTNH